MAKRESAPRGPKPEPSGVCECGFPTVDYEAEWQIAPTAHMKIHGRPATEDRDATLPGYRHGDEVWTPVCFPSTPDRYTSRAYGEHVIRLALRREDGLQHVPALRRKFGIVEPMTLPGYTAIRYARVHRLTLRKYADLTEGARDGLTPDEAEQVAAEDPGLIYVVIG
jgi:hypothetical protein